MRTPFTPRYVVTPIYVVIRGYARAVVPGDSRRDHPAVDLTITVGVVTLLFDLPHTTASDVTIYCFVTVTVHCR